MRRFTAFLLLAAATGMVMETGLTRADDGNNPPNDENVDRPNDEGPPEPGRGRRGERRRRGPGPEGPPGEGGPHGHHEPPPIIAALDADGDGVISASEIEGAIAALKTLDKNNDGELTKEELHPRGHGGPPGPGEGFGHRSFGGPEGPGGDRGPRGKRGGREGRRERPSPEQFIEKVMEADTDGDGTISKDEAPERLSRGFDHIDTDGNGSIDRTELEEASQRFGRKRGSGGRRREGQPRGEGGPNSQRKKDRRPALDDDSEA